MSCQVGTRAVEGLAQMLQLKMLQLLTSLFSLKYSKGVRSTNVLVSQKMYMMKYVDLCNGWVYILRYCIYMDLYSCLFELSLNAYSYSNVTLYIPQSPLIALQVAKILYKRCNRTGTCCKIFRVIKKHEKKIYLQLRLLLKQKKDDTSNSKSQDSI